MAVGLAQRIKRLREKTLRPPPELTLVEWADKYRKLSRESSAEPGPWRTDRVECARGPMLAVTDPSVHTISVMSCTQLLKTELINNTVGYFISEDPSPIIVMQPTDKMANVWSTDRLDKMIRDTPILSEKFGQRKSRVGSNTISHKEFPGGFISVVGANSPANLASRPIRVVLCDELDKYPPSASEEGDPLTLLSERSATFWNSLKIYVCSPTIDGRSRIQAEYEKSDRRVYLLKCPHCLVQLVPKWKYVKWTRGDLKTARYHCEHCGERWKESERLNAIQHGEWKATAPFNGHAGFHVSKLCSPWESLTSIAQKFVDTNQDPQRLKVFMNTQLAETWKQSGEAPDWERLYERRENYKIGVVPRGVVFLTCGVDVQDKSIEAEVKGWSRTKESWSIEKFVFQGDTSTDDPWNELHKLLDQQWIGENDVPYSIMVMAVDSGFRTQVVYNWCRRYPMSRVIAVKGTSSSQTLINSGSVVDIMKGRRRHSKGFKVFTIGVDLVKNETYGYLKLPKPTSKKQRYLPGYCHFPEYEPEYFQQLTAEELMRKVIHGHATYYWEKIRDRNEALDMHVYNRAAACYFGMDRMRDDQWDSLMYNTKELATVENPKSFKIKRKPSQFL